MTDGARWRPAALRAATIVLVVAVGLAATEDLTSLLTDASLWAIAALGVGLVLGLGGQPALCQGAFMLVGAYAYALTTRAEGPAIAPLAGLGAAVVVGCTLALLVSPVLRGRGYTLALATIALDLFVRQALRTGEWLPGQDAGLAGIPPLRIGPWELVEPEHYLRLGVGLVLVTGLVLHLVVGRGHRRRALRTLAHDQQLLAHLGQNPTGYKRALFVVSGGLGAVAGALVIAAFGYVQPTSFTVQDSFVLAVAVVIGGRERIAGAVLGVFVYQVTATVLGPEHAAYQPAVLGVMVILVMELAPEGLLPSGGLVNPLRSALRRRPPAPAPQMPDVAATQADGALLQTAGVTCDFGALRAVDDVAIELEPGSIVALVGPNGAGKSTLLNAIVGGPMSSGSILLDGVELTRRPTHARVRAGISLSHQHVRLVAGATAEESVMVGVDLATRRGRPTSEQDRRRRARSCLAAMGVESVSDRRTEDLSTVERRLVDIARVLAAEPRLALLDEPSAGLDPAECQQVIGAIEHLHRSGSTVLLVEHDLNFVRAVAQRVVALVGGRVLAEGPTDEILTLPAFEQAYLGGVLAR